MAMREPHQVFLQGFMSRGILGSREVKELYIRSHTKFDETPEIAQLASYVSTINNNIRPFHMEIRKGIDERNGSHWYGMINTTDSSITRMASDYTVVELELFKKIVEDIVKTDEGEISSTDALNLVNTVENEGKKLSRTQAQDLIGRLRSDRWLAESVHGEVSLSIRALLELEHYIQQQLPDYCMQCNTCKRLAVKGQVCGSCDTKLHIHCAARYFCDVAEPKCPNKRCNAPWSHPVPRSAKEQDSVQTQNTQESQRERKRKR